MKLVSIAAATIAVLTSACSITESALVGGTSRPAGGSLPTMVGCGVTGQPQVIARQARVQSGVEVASFQSHLAVGYAVDSTHGVAVDLDPLRSRRPRAPNSIHTGRFITSLRSSRRALWVARRMRRAPPHRERRAHDRRRFPLRGRERLASGSHGPTARPTSLTSFGRSATRLSICSAVYRWAPIAAMWFPSARTGRSSSVRSPAKRAFAVRWFRSTPRPLLASSRWRPVMEW